MDVVFLEVEKKNSNIRIFGRFSADNIRRRIRPAVIFSADFRPV